LFPYHWTRLGDVVRAIAVVHNMNLEAARSEL
jgi:phage protein D